MNEKEMERSLKALANRRRLSIIRFLKREKEATVGTIAAHIRLSFKSTSRHLSILAGANLLEKDQRSTQVFYRIAEGQPEFIRKVISTV